MADKTFTVAGTSKLNGVMTFRVANGEAKKRMWVLKHNEHTDINLIDLDKPMSKTAAVAFLIAHKHPGADVAVVPGSGTKGKTPEQVAAEEEAKRVAAEEAKRVARNAARKLARANAKAAKASESDEEFVATAGDDTQEEAPVAAAETESEAE